ncbi:MAG: hypothetical protein IKD89_01150 [Clostridia bacterium]|nr:hypothetical protein [Clostridia bacterium]
MKNAKKIVALTIAVLMIAVLLTGCGGGGSSSQAETGYEGTYVSVKVEAFGFDMTGSDAEGFTLTLDKGGKGVMDIEGDSSNIKWKLDGNAITIEAGGDKMTGTVEGDTVYIEDLGGMGMNILFAKEGSEAANPANYVSEDDATYVGVWQSAAVYDVEGNDASAEIAPDAYYMELYADKSAVVYFNGNDMGQQAWSTFGDLGMIDDLNVMWEANEDGSITVSYYEDDYYFDFVCVKYE